MVENRLSWYSVGRNKFGFLAVLVTLLHTCVDDVMLMLVLLDMLGVRANFVEDGCC